MICYLLLCHPKDGYFVIIIRKEPKSVYIQISQLTKINATNWFAQGAGTVFIFKLCVHNYIYVIQACGASAEIMVSGYM